jgi:hypothetical protein
LKHASTDGIKVSLYKVGVSSGFAAHRGVELIHRHQLHPQLRDCALLTRVARPAATREERQGSVIDCRLGSGLEVYREEHSVRSNGAWLLIIPIGLLPVGFFTRSHD